MWRPFFLGIGITLCLVGAECLVLDHVILSSQQRPLAPQGSLFGGEPLPGAGRVVTPPDWAPWTLMASGAVVLLYSFTIPARVQEG